MDAESDSLTVTEAAELLHMTPGGVSHMLRGKWLAGEKVKGKWRIARSEVARKLAEDLPRGYFVRQHAASVELATGRFKMPTAAT